MSKRRVLKKDLVVAPCVAACPAGVDAPRYIRWVKAGRYDEAVAVIRERIPFPTVCADACFAPCEDACAYKQFGDPVAIRALKRAAVDRGGDLWKKNKKCAEKTGKAVAIIGAGPAGLTAAYYLATLGHSVTLFDGFAEPGGTMRYGIPEFRLPKAHLKKDVQAILELGVAFKARTVIGRDLSFDRLQTEFDALFIACGAVGSTRLPIEGADKANVFWGWDFLKDVSLGKPFRFHGNMIVIGGGNVALDAARTAKRLGAETVTIVYRRTRREMPAHPAEIAAAEQEGVMIVDSWAPKKILGDPVASAVTFVKCFSTDGASCKAEPAYDEEVTHKLTADAVILAIGQSPYLGFLSGQEGIEIQKETIRVSEENLATGLAGVFAGGDVVSGPASIISAIAHGRRAAAAIDRYLGGTGDITEVLAEPEDALELPEKPQQVSARVDSPLIKPWQRVSSFDQVEGGYDPDHIVAESARCLMCDARRFTVTVYPENCKACGYCAEVCRMGVFHPSERFNLKGYQPMACTSSDVCVGCLKCYFACPDFAIDIEEMTGS